MVKLAETDDMNRVNFKIILSSFSVCLDNKVYDHIHKAQPYFSYIKYQFKLYNMHASLPVYIDLEQKADLLFP